MPLEEIPLPNMLTVELDLEGTGYNNSWQIWVYDHQKEPDTGEVLVTDSFTEAFKVLAQGGKVLLSPPLNKIRGIEGKFVPVFWSPVHFPNQPGTMGILCAPSHPVFTSFPTEFHSNWQWWDISKNSESVQIDDLDVQPLITVMDNFFKNRKMANLFEVKVGDGSLVFSSMDLAGDLEHRPASRQLKKSILEYMNTTGFSPQSSVNAREIQSFYTVAESEKLDVLSIYDHDD